MPTINPRINVTLEPETYQVLSGMAKLEGMSLSHIVSRLVNLAIELGEDLALVQGSKERLNDFRRDDAKTSDDLIKWNKTRKKK